MSFVRLVLASLLYYWRTNLAVAAGVVAGTAVLTGALLVGDSMKGSLRHLALDRLGYSQEERDAITIHIGEHETIEGAPHLKESHLPIFDCAMKPLNGERFISPMGHVGMMAAVQPFLSGAISKTVNLPNETTPEEIADIYLEAWRKGLKAIAVYRDGSKRTQPVNTSEREDKKSEKEKETKPVPARRRLVGR